MPRSISWSMVYCGVALAGCGGRATEPKAPLFVYDHAASLWLLPDGTPDPGRPTLVADAPTGLGVRRAQFGLSVTVDGRPLPPGMGAWRGRTEFVTTGSGKGYEYVTRVRFAQRDVHVDCVVTDVDGPPGPTLRLDGRQRAGDWKRVSSPGERPAWRAAVALPTLGSGKTGPALSAPGSVGPRIWIEGPTEDVEAIIRLEHQLGSDTFAGRSALPPFGSTSERYAGRVFWDADIWLLPALALTHPLQARSVPCFRAETLPGAQKEYSEWISAGRPTGSDADGRHRRMGPLESPPPGLKVPWEAGAQGQELCTGEGRWAHHATADAAWGMRFASQIGLASLPQAEAYCRLASGFYHSRALRHPGGSFSIVDTLSPDENAHVEHDSYTNLAADLVTRWAGAPLGKPHLPRQGRALLNYSGDRGGRLNQHALLLAVWPWEHPAAVARAPEILASCRGRANPDGPAMSLSIEALAEARYGDPDRALATWREAFRRYEHGPQLLMGETRNRPAGVFRTGVAGCWSAVLYGFLGVHVGEQPTPGSLWQRRLESGAWVSVRPRLPSAWKRVDFRIVLDGVPVRLSASRTGVAAVQGPVVQAEGTRFRR